MQDIERFRGGMSVYTSRAVDAMKDGRAGDVISLERMESIVGRPCGNQDSGRGNVASAIKYVLREFGAAWEWDRSARGWRCLSSADKLEVMPRKIKRARSQIRRGMAIIATANIDDLTEEQRRVLKAHSIHAGTLLLFSSPKAVRHLEAAGLELRKPQTEKLLELMQKRK